MEEDRPYLDVKYLEEESGDESVTSQNEEEGAGEMTTSV